jgi:hypothetical protein
VSTWRLQTNGDRSARPVVEVNPAKAANQRRKATKLAEAILAWLEEKGGPVFTDASPAEQYRLAAQVLVRATHETWVVLAARAGVTTPDTTKILTSTVLTEWADALDRPSRRRAELAEALTR